MHPGLLLVDFVPNLNIEEVKSVLCQHRNKFAGQFKDEFVTAVGVPLTEVPSVAHFPLHEACIKLTFSSAHALYTDITEYHGEQDSAASVLCGGGAEYRWCNWRLQFSGAFEILQL
ncbi:uncharacterized protein [Primulina huaijiensis]|uniref:uncharacterized protein isoform X2 n=1 Tax=Primulina huaijiensis TaxID=1492673 RepID=UPI003CC73CC6